MWGLPTIKAMNDKAVKDAKQQKEGGASEQSKVS